MDTLKWKASFDIFPYFRATSDFQRNQRKKAKIFLDQRVRKLL